MEVNSHFKAVFRLTYGTYIPECTAHFLVKHTSDYNRNTTEGTQRKEKPPWLLPVIPIHKNKSQQGM
jgi:hypothetical protein